MKTSTVYDGHAGSAPAAIWPGHGNCQDTNRAKGDPYACSEIYYGQLFVCPYSQISGKVCSQRMRNWPDISE